VLKRARKEEIISSLRESINSANAMFVTNLVGVSANTAVKIRKDVRDAKGKVVITRNTLFQRAAQGTYCEDLFNGIKGPHAVAFSFEDAPGVAKAIFDAGKDNELVDLKGGFLREKSLTEAEIKMLAQLPSRDQMLATLLATFNAPISAFARVLNAIKDNKSEGATEEAKAESPAAEEAVTTETTEQ
jgi:large subunit ribosomal protein L10